MLSPGVVFKIRGIAETAILLEFSSLSSNPEKGKLNLGRAMSESVKLHRKMSGLLAAGYESGASESSPDVASGSPNRFFPDIVETHSE
ncbi:hypothetical protein ACFX1W_008289 [Malus domestica]